MRPVTSSYLPTLAALNNFTSLLSLIAHGWSQWKRKVYRYVEGGMSFFTLNTEQGRDLTSSHFTILPVFLQCSDVTISLKQQNLKFEVEEVLVQNFVQ